MIHTDYRSCNEIGKNWLCMIWEGCLVKHQSPFFKENGSYQLFSTIIWGSLGFQLSGCRSLRSIKILVWLIAYHPCYKVYADIASSVSHSIDIASLFWGIINGPQIYVYICRVSWWGCRNNTVWRVHLLLIDQIIRSFGVAEVRWVCWRQSRTSGKVDRKGNVFFLEVPLSKKTVNTEKLALPHWVGSKMRNELLFSQ